MSFKNIVKESEDFNVLTYSYFYQGGGVAVGDINNDGLPDLYFTGNMVASKLFLNKGNFEFEDITKQAGVAAEGLWNTGVTMVDVDGDGWLDIYICRSAANDPNNRRNLLFINNGNNTFTESAKEYGLDDPGYSTQASFFDYDGDGDLDMFLLNHSTQEFAGFSRIDGSFKKRKGQYLGDKLYRNDGGKFVDVTEDSGIISNVLGFGLAVTISDINQDGWLDIYVSNDYNEEDYLYINQGDGTFKESVDDYMGHVSLFSMGADAADINNDALPDIITMDMMPEFSFNQKSIIGPENYDKYRELLQKGFFPQSMRNMLHLNLGNGYFSEIGQFAGVAQTDWSWAVLAADFDNDGHKDIFISNGYERNYLDMDFLNYMVSERLQPNQIGKDAALIDLIEKMPPIYVENYLFHNNKDLTFSNRASEWGLGGLNVSNASAYADLDGDGDLDLIVCHTNEEVSIYRNNSERLFEHHYLKVKLEGQDGNTTGVGAKLWAYAGEETIFQEQIPVRGYQSSVDHTLVMGLGGVSELDSLVVNWPDGGEQIFYQVGTDQLLTLSQAEAASKATLNPSPIQKVEVVEAEVFGIDFRHEESGFLDFTQDRLMPNAMSGYGPRLAIGDLNGDGLEDIVAGGGKDQATRIFLQEKSGRFRLFEQPDFETDKAFTDTGLVLIDINGNGHLDLYIGSGGSDYPSAQANYLDRFYVNDGRGNFSRSQDAIPTIHSSTSVVVAGDFNGDGLEDLFVGARFIPGQYPLAPESHLLINSGEGRFRDATSEFHPSLGRIGMVADAAIGDVNGNGRQDLMIVGEWMDVTLFTNVDGKSFKIEDLKLSGNPLQGWWKHVALEDIDGDGDLDIVLGNHGTNIHFKANEEQPLRLIYKDFDGNGFIDPIFTYYQADTNAFAFSRDELIGQIPNMKGRFPDYRSFSKTPVEEFFQKEDWKGADSLKADMLYSLVGYNNGEGKFEFRPLPRPAQFSPLFASVLWDMDGDGILDLITGGNSSRVRVSVGKQDANPGFYFLGKKENGFDVGSPSFSNLGIRGEIRDMQKITIGGEEMVLVARNSQGLLFLRKK
ncbi:VCBS repeat-containing protein [Pleomorphovibrio marinus]|uniref:VCBS repeat-containing protein n=1 Tax=Pleomorphovibrio marinus TaxID=2164132 RepID=UPI001E35BEC5|nr:VCBS repeat-containing protein [Pleomorphovibrio marinus]